MEADSIIPNSSCFRNAIQLTNGVPTDRLSLLLERIITKLAKEEKPFSEAELIKLQEVLGLEQEGLQSLIDASTFAFERAAINSVSAEQFVTVLKPSGLSSSSLAAFKEVWVRSGCALETAFKKRPLGAPGNSQLADVQWRVHVQAHKASGEKSLVLGFSHMELFDFFERLEHIQEQLDSLL